MTGDQSNDSIPLLRFPAPVIHTWDLLRHLGNACLDIETLHQTQLAPVTPAPLSFGGCDSFGAVYKHQLDLACFICTLDENNYDVDSLGAVMEVVKAME
ncbi:hypothetical protein CDAR_196181 [Caerostris darwini]|uniref:Uncharacterized protein n=1 Tax=Caerostris darwini TaxID=1538125 RepID=A0AAV4MJ47_9ARAC|nr:hypothetical protein CDAR_196181 [Caerostris darwini]